METNSTQPRWLTLKGASDYSGLSVRLLADLIKDQELVSALVRRKGRRSGRRLIERESLDSFISQGIPEPPALGEIEPAGKPTH